MFGEAATQRICSALAGEGWRFLALDEDAVQRLEERLGMLRDSGPLGVFPSVTHKLLTIDQSAFQLTCPAG